MIKSKRSTIILAAVIGFLIAVSWIGNGLYYRSGQLEKPLFLNHEEIISTEGGGMIQLYYLENKRPGKKVTAIRLEELPELYFQLNVSSSYIHQNLMQATVSAPNGLKPGLYKEARVHYSDGESQLVPIGSLEIKKLANRNFDISSSGGSSDGTGFLSGIASKTFTMDEVDPGLSEIGMKQFHSEIKAILPGATDYAAIELPMKLSKGTQLRIDYRWSQQNAELERPTMFVPWLTLVSHASDGTVYRDYYPINFNLYLNESQVRSIVRKAAGK